ncbi:MAG: hypothetical protein JWP48_5126, partial [Actinoallomurus sp.]|nr:hypothetical protein [Actinoallomurus sp.]
TVKEQTATAHLLPLGDGTEIGPTSRFPTSIEALKQAVIYFADFSGMRDVLTAMLGELAGPQGASDQELATIAGTTGGRAHDKEILNREFTTDLLFDPGFFRDVLAAVDISGAMGKTTFLGSTADSFVTGIIKLWLAQASTSDNSSTGITWQQLNLTAGGADGTTALTGGADVNRRWARNRSATDTRTGGTELIQLDFNRAYAYMTTVDFTVRAVLEKIAKLLPHSKKSEVQQLLGRLMIFLLPEPEALAQYADTGLPISDARLADALNRWKLNLRPDPAAGAAAPLVLAGDVVAKILMRWATEVPELPDSAGVDRDELIQALSELHANGALPVTDAETREAFNRQFGTSLPDRADPLHDIELPEYLRREDPDGRILGHHGVQDMTFDRGETTLRLVERKINEVAPGLLTSDPEVWDGKGRMIGRMQGGIDSLQAILARGRDQAMLEDVLDLEGMTFYLVNPVGWLLSDVVEINLSAQLTSQPDVREFRPDTGLENYGHGYVGTSRSRSRDGGHTFNYGKFAVGRAAGPDDSPTDPPPSGSGAGGLRTSEGHHRDTIRSEIAVSEQTVYDWTGHYRTAFDIELTAQAKRLDMSGRPLNNALLHWFERWTHHNAQATETVAGRLELQVPRAIAEAGVLRGPAPLRHLTPLPELPHNVYILGTLFGDAYQIAREMADDIFGREHGSTTVTHLNSLATRLRPTHVRNHLWEATAGGGYTLAEGIFMPGHSSHRATMGLKGDLYDMQVIGVAKQGTGTGLYVKHESGTTAKSTSGRWRSEADISETTTGTLHPHDPPHTGENKDATTRASAAAQTSAGTENHRRELHVKEQGPVVMVRLRGQFRIEAEEFRHHLFRKPTKGAHFRSDPITGDVYALLDQAQVAELQARLAESTERARAAAAAWPALDGAPTFDLGRLLTDAARKKFDAGRMYQEVARQIRQQAGGDRPLVLDLDQAAFGAETLLSVLRWAEGALSEHRVAGEPSDASNTLARLIRTYRDLPPRAPGDAITALINAVNALHPEGGPRSLPVEVAAFASDPVTLARDVAHELQAHVRLDVTRPDGTTQQRWADSDGRVYVLDPLTFDDTTLPADLAQAAGLLPETLRRDVYDLDINAFDLGRLYRTSWTSQRTFEQALSAEIHQRRSRLAALDPRLPDLLGRASGASRRSAADVRSLEERQREVVQRIAAARRRLEEVDGELLALRTELDGPWSFQAAPPDEDAVRARIETLEAEQGDRERDLAILSDQDQDLETRLSRSRAYERDALRILDDLRGAAREMVDAARLDAARRRAASLLPASERPTAARQQALRRLLTRWTADDGPRELDLGRLLSDTVRQEHDASPIHQEVARRIRRQAGGDRPLVLSLDQAAFGAETLLSVLRWAERALSEHRVAGEPSDASNTLARLIRTYRDLPPRAPENAITALVNAVNALHPDDGPRPLPREVPAFSMDPVTLVRRVAGELGAHVRLDVTRTDGTTQQRWADSDGRVYVLDPLTFDDTTLPADLAQSAGLLPETLRRDVDDLHIGASDLGRLYRTSWTSQRTFEQALSAEIHQRRSRLAALDPRLPDLLAGAADGGPREWNAQAVDSVTGRLDAVESAIASTSATPTGTSAVPPERERIVLAYRRWAAGKTAESLDHLEDLLRDAGHGSMSLILTDEPSQRFVALNRDGEIRWVDFPTGTAAAPPEGTGTGAFLALGPTGTVLQPPPELHALGADATSFPGLHASIHASMQDRPGAVRPAGAPGSGPSTPESPMSIGVDAPLPDDPHLYTDGSGYRIGPPVLSGGTWHHVGALADYAPVHWLTHGARRNGVTLADIASTDRGGAATFLSAEQGMPRGHALRAFLESTTGRRVEEMDRLPADPPAGTWIFWFRGQERIRAAIVLADGRYRHYQPGTHSTLTGLTGTAPDMTGETDLRFIVAHPTADPTFADAHSYAPIHWLRRGTPDDGVNVEDVLRDDRDGVAQFMAGDAISDAQRVTRFMRTTGRGVESATALPTGLPVGTWIWFSSSEFTGSAVVMPDHRYLTYVPGIHRTGLRSDRAVRAMMGRTPYAFVIARPVTAPGTSAGSVPRRPDQRSDGRRTTRARTGIESAAAVSGVESTELLADAVERGSLDRIVERLVERPPGPSAGEVHESLAELNLGGTREEIVGFLLGWRGDFDLRALSLLESVSRRAHGRSLVDVVPELPGLWLGRRVESLVARGMPSRAVEIIDQVRNRPAALSSIALSQGRRRTGLMLDLGIDFPDAGALADAVRDRVQRGEHDPAARLLSGIEHDTLSLLALADVYFTAHRRDILVDVPALAGAVRNLPPASPVGLESESAYDIAQLERALAAVPDDGHIDVHIAFTPARLRGPGGHTWMEIRLPIGDPEQQRSDHGRVFSIGYRPEGPPSAEQPSRSVVHSPDISDHRTVSVRRRVSADQLRQGIELMREVADDPSSRPDDGGLAFANALHSAIVGGRPFRGLATVVMRPARTDRTPAAVFPPTESLGRPEVMTTLSFADNSSVVGETAREAIGHLVQGYAGRLIANARAGRPAPPVRITAFSSRPGPAGRRMAPLPRRRAAALREVFLDALEEELKLWLPARASQIARSEVPLDVRLTPGTARQAAIAVFAPANDARPADALTADEWFTALGRSADALRRPDTVTTAGSRASTASARSTVRPDALPASSADDPQPPWYVAQGALGDGTVIRVDTVVDASVKAWIDELTAGMRPAAAAAVRRRILAVLAKKDAKTWEKLLRSGTLIRRRGVSVKLTFSVEDSRHEQPGDEPAEEGLQTFFSKYGDTSYSEGSSRHRRRALSGRLEPLLFIIEGALSHLSPSVKIGAENEYGSGRSIAMEVQSGNRVIANATHGYAGRIRVRATVNRRTRPDLLLPGTARLAFPTVYSSTAEALAPPADLDEGGHPTVRVTNPEVLQGLDHAVNAVVPQALVAGLRTELEALGLPRDIVDELVQEVTEEFFNEKTLKDRSQWWLTGSWVSAVFTGKKFARADFAGHLEVSGRPRTVRYVTTTEQEVLLRNDIADTALLRDGGEHHSRASAATALAGGVEVGDHLITPGVELPMVRSSSGQSHTVVAEGQAKNAIMRKDRLVRYVTEFTMVVKLRSATHGDREYTAPMPGELGIGRTHAAYFERLALEGATGSGLQPPEDVPAPLAEPRIEPELPEPARATRAQRLVRWLGSRFAPERMPWPFPAPGLHGVDDLLRLADLGPIEIAVPPELHDDGDPRGPLTSEGWDALRAYNNVSWLYANPEKSTVVSYADERGGPAPWRYVLDAGGRVVGALFMAPETTPGEGRRPTGYVPNPVVPRAAEPPAPRPVAWYEALLGPLTDAGLDAIADYLRAGGVPQIQLTDTVQARVATAPEDDALRKATRALKDAPALLVVAADGSRLSTGDRPGRAPEARFVIDKDGGVRGPLPVWDHVVHPAEPIELAARKGLGPGILRETPGLERLFREAQNALAHQMRVAGVEDLLSATDRQHLARVLAMKFGVPGLRGGYPALMAGAVGHEVRVGGYVFSVAADVQLRALRRDPVAEGGVSLDSQHKGVSGLSTVEQTGIELGAAVSGRFRARFPGLFSLDVHTIDAGAKRSWTRKIIDTTGVKEYRRARTNGDVTRFEYEAVYTLVVTTRRPAGEVHAAHVRELSGPDHWAAVTVSNALLPETPIPPDDIVALGQVTVVDLPDDGGPWHGSAAYGQDALVELASDITRLPLHYLGTEFDLNAEGLSGLQARLIGTEELSRNLAEMVAAHNDVPWLSAKGDAFRQVLTHIVPTGAGYGVAERITRTGTPTFLEALARRMIRKGRLRIALPPTADGWNQEMTIWLRTFGARHEKAVTGITQEQYTEADLRFGEEVGVTDSADASGGAGAVFRVGPQPAAEGDHTTSTKASSQASFGATGGVSGSRGRYTADLGGGLDLNLGTYSGTSHSFGANAVYELVHRRWRDDESRSAKRLLGIRRGLTLLAPHVRALDHGLPVPPGEEPPAEHQERYLVDRELAMAVSYIEDADAAGVLPAIEEILGDVDAEVLRAARTAFDEEVLRAEYPIARSGGIHQIITSPARFWRDRTLWEYLKIPAEFRGTVRTGIRVVVEEEEPESHRRPRPDVKVTTGGQAFTQTSRGVSRSGASHVAAYGHGRWAGTGEGLRVAGGAHVEYESAHSSKQGSTATIRDIRRATAKDGSQEFAAKARWRIEVYQHVSPNELFYQAGRAVSAVPRLVEILSRGESLRFWQRFFPPGRAPLDTRQVDVRASALVPEHLTTTAPPVAAPAGKAVVAISRTPAPESSPLAKVLAQYMHALATPGSGQLPPWAPVAAVPWRRIDPRAITRGIAPYFEHFAPDTQDRFTIELALTERNLRANIAALLKGTYRIPLLDGTVLMVQLVPKNGRWLTRGGYTGFNFPEDSAEPERETEVRRGWGYGFDAEVGHPVGKPLAEGAETPLLDGGPASDHGRETVRAVKKNSTGDYVESNIQRDGDYDYYRFDAEFVISGPHAHTVTVGIANGLIGMLPSVVLGRLGSLDGLGPAEPVTVVPTDVPHHGPDADVPPVSPDDLVPDERQEAGAPALSEPDAGRPAPRLSEAQAVRPARLAADTHDHWMAAVPVDDITPYRPLPDAGLPAAGQERPATSAAPEPARRVTPPAYFDEPRSARRDTPAPLRPDTGGEGTGGRPAPSVDIDPDGTVYVSSTYSATDRDGRPLPPGAKACVEVAVVRR